MTTVYFDDIDVFLVANRMTLRELRRELYHAEAELSACEAFCDTPYSSTDADLNFWRWFAKVAREAIAWHKARPPTPSPAPARGRVDVEALKERADIVAIAERYTRLRKSGKRFTGKCPLHDDKSPSFVVYPDDNSWHCFGCGKGGDVISLVMEAEHTDFRGAVAVLGGR